MRKKTLAAFEEWKADPMSSSVLVQRIAEGETLRDVCTSLKQPYSLVAAWIAGTPLLKAQYDAALAMKGDAYAQEAVGIADAAAGETEGAAVSAAKLRVETRLKLAGKLDRERYGEREAPKVQVNIALGDVAREIVELEQRLGISAGATVDLLPAVPAAPAAVPIQQADAVEAPI